MSNQADDSSIHTVRVAVRRKPMEGGGDVSKDPVGPVNYCTVDDFGNPAGFTLDIGGQPVTEFPVTCFEFQEDFVPEGGGHAPYRLMSWDATISQSWSMKRRDTSGNIDVAVSQTFLNQNQAQIGPAFALGNFLRECSNSATNPPVTYKLDNSHTAPVQLPNLISILRQCDHGIVEFRYRTGDDCR